MSATPSPSELLAEREALIGCDALLSELVRQRGEMKLCYDDEDGWFVQFLCIHSLKDSWMTLDRDEERHASPTAAIKAARLAHNDEVERQRKSGRCAIHQIIPDNVEVVAPATESATQIQGKGFSSGFNLRLAAGSGLSTHALLCRYFCVLAEDVDYLVGTPLAVLKRGAADLPLSELAVLEAASDELDPVVGNFGERRFTKDALFKDNFRCACP